VGNKLGWILAGSMLAVFVIVVVTLVLWPEGPTPPTDATTTPGRLDLKTIEMSPETIVGSVPSGAGNAGDDYAEAVELRQAEEATIIKTFGAGIDDPTAEGLRLFERIDEIVARGTKKKEMRFTTIHADETFKMTHRMAGALRLQEIGTVLNKLAQHYLAVGKTDRAREVWKREFILGMHMINERSRPHMVTSGIGNQREAVRGLAAIARKEGKQDRLETLQAYTDQMNDLSDFFRMKLGFIWKAEPREYAGDVFNIARNDEDRAWQAEAVLFLGVLKFTQGHEPDLELIDTLLKKYRGSDDPYIRTAAEAAEAFTRKEFRRLDAIDVE
jgi:hypothetical protein